jgi:hypothetical protein
LLPARRELLGIILILPPQKIIIVIALVRKQMSNQVVDKSLPKIRMEKPITNTRFSTLPTACVRGATLSKVLVAN